MLMYTFKQCPANNVLYLHGFVFYVCPSFLRSFLVHGHHQCCLLVFKTASSLWLTLPNHVELHSLYWPCLVSAGYPQGYSVRSCVCIFVCSGVQPMSAANRLLPLFSPSSHMGGKYGWSSRFGAKLVTNDVLTEVKIRTQSWHWQMQY